MKCQRQPPLIFAREQEWLRLATLLEGVRLAFDIQKCLKFQKSIMVVLKM